MPETNSTNSFELRFHFTTQEFHALRYITQLNTWSHRFQWALFISSYWMIAGFIALPIVFYAPLRQEIIDRSGFYGPPLIIFLVALLLVAFHWRIIMPAMMRDALRASYGGNEIAIVVNNSGIVFRNSGITIDVPWHAVHAVTDAFGCIMLMSGEANGVAVPRRVFATPEEAERFLSFAREKAEKK